MSSKTVTVITQDIEVPAGATLTISDPCYLTPDGDDLLVFDLDVAHSGHMGWQTTDLTPGTWEAFAEIVDAGDWGKRVKSSGLRMVPLAVGGTEVTSQVEHWQGVDAGMVGYFINEPIRSYEEVWTIGSPTCYHSDDNGSMWNTSSGFGDGSYDVIVTRDGVGKIHKVETIFLGDDEL